jgi:hypothetical protein
MAGPSKRGTIPIRVTAHLAREVADWLHSNPSPPTALHDTDEEQRRLQRLIWQFNKAGARKRGNKDFEIRLTRSDVNRLVALALGIPFMGIFGWRYGHRPGTPVAVRHASQPWLGATRKRRGNPNFQRLTHKGVQAKLNNILNCLLLESVDESTIRRLKKRNEQYARMDEEMRQGKITASS